MKVQGGRLGRQVGDRGGGRRVLVAESGVGEVHKLLPEVRVWLHFSPKLGRLACTRPNSMPEMDAFSSSLFKICTTTGTVTKSVFRQHGVMTVIDL